MVIKLKVNKREKLEYKITLTCRGSGEAKEIGLISNYTSEVIEGYITVNTYCYYTLTYLFPASAKAVDFALNNAPFDLRDPNTRCNEAEIEINNTAPSSDTNIYRSDNLILNHSGIDFQPLGKLELTKYQIDQIIGMQISFADGESLVEIEDDYTINDYLACIEIIKKARSREKVEETLESYLY